MEPLRLVLEGVSHRHPGAVRETPRAVSAVLAAGSKTLLEGPVGAGKTTLLRRIAGLETGAGFVLIGDRPVEAATLHQTRRGMGFLWQTPDDGLFLPGVLEDVALGPVNDGVAPRQARERAESALRQLGVGDLAPREISTLSHGERQLVALAGLLARESGLLLLDEPLSSLDAPSRQRVLAALGFHPATVLLATHEGSRDAFEIGFRRGIRLD